MGLRIVIDRERCMGSGNCTYAAGATFDLDDELLAHVIDPDGDPEEKVRLAADGCPTQAITVTAEPEGA